MLRFLGPKNELFRTRNSATRACDRYWTRHCSLRPRDAIVIGKEISLIGVKRRTQQEVRNAINSAAAERVETLFNEVAPFFSGLYPEIFPQVIKSNVLTYDEVVEASTAYADIAARQYEIETEAARHPFCALYALGLVGIVNGAETIPPGSYKVRSVGEIAFGKIHVLPNAETYLIHPSLSDFITRRNVGFLKELNKHNVIGDELEWRPEESIRFVAVGEIRGYRENVVQVAGKSQTSTNTGAICSGSSPAIGLRQDHRRRPLVLADRSPGRLLHAARGLNGQLSASGYNCRCEWARIAASEARSGLGARSIPKFPTSLSLRPASSRSQNPETFSHSTIRIKPDGTDDARGKDPSLVDDQYVGAKRYQAGAGVLISKESEAVQYVPIYLFGSADARLLEDRQEPRACSVRALQPALKAQDRTPEADVRPGRRRGRSGRSPLSPAPAEWRRLCRFRSAQSASTSSLVPTAIASSPVSALRCRRAARRRGEPKARA